jgi:CRISPR-associated protein Csm2
MASSNEQWNPKVITEAEVTRIISGDPRLLVDKAKQFAISIKDVSSSQIRNAFGTMRKLQMWGWEDPKTQSQLLLLKPRLAYTAGRQPSKSAEPYMELRDVLCHSIDQVKDDPTFINFCNFFEAILAYHKAHGGKS